MKKRASFTSSLARRVLAIGCAVGGHRAGRKAVTTTPTPILEMVRKLPT